MDRKWLLGLAALLFSFAPAKKNVWAEPAGFQIKRISTGVVVPNRSVTLSSKISGRVVTVKRDEGESIKKGKLLLALEDSEYRADLKASNASLRIARADAQFKKKEQAKIEKLFTQKSVSETSLDRAILDYTVAVETVKKSEAAVARAVSILAETRIIAPFNAVVIERHVEVGQITSPSSPLFVIEDQSKLKFRTSVRERDIPHVKMGQKVKVVIDALGGGGKITGTVAKIIPSGDTTTHSFVVELLLPTRKGLYVGMFGKADFSNE